MKLPLIEIGACPKNYAADLDKAISPEETIAIVTRKLAGFGQEVFLGSRRVDRGRLGIPVYMGICGADARAIMPTRKQMGKGSSIAQAQASALMELMERYAFFSFWRQPPHAVSATWSEAKNLFASDLIPIGQILLSVNEQMDEKDAEKLLDLRRWLFYPATDLTDGKITWLPMDWFRMLGEFNGSSAGNTPEESLLQGISELIERHVCALIDRQQPVLPTIDAASCADPVLQRLLAAFKDNGVNLILKDFSLGMPLPTVGAVAWDEATFPDSSEIVFTAGTATSPAKAAIRAITEVAQLGGDFCSHSCYEASGLPKYRSIEEIAWLRQGPAISLDALPNLSSADIGQEIRAVLAALAPMRVYGIETTHPDIGVCAHYAIAPGLQFRERDRNQCLGLFIGRKLAEESEPEEGAAGLAQLAQIYPDAHFLPFFQGMLNLRRGETELAIDNFKEAMPLQPDPESLALAAFYAGHAHTLLQQWLQAIAPLEQALQASPQMKEAANLLGVAHFKLKNYEQAERCFDAALKIDKGSAMDLANRGLARKFQGKTPAAAEDLAIALELDPTLTFARKHLDELQNQAD